MPTDTKPKPWQGQGVFQCHRSCSDRQGPRPPPGSISRGGEPRVLWETLSDAWLGFVYHVGFPGTEISFQHTHSQLSCHKKVC